MNAMDGCFSNFSSLTVPGHYWQANLLLDIEQRCSLEFLCPEIMLFVEHMLLRGSQRDFCIRWQPNCGIWEISDVKKKSFKKHDYQGLYKEDEISDWPFSENWFWLEENTCFIRRKPHQERIITQRTDRISLCKWHTFPPLSNTLRVGLIETHIKRSFPAHYIWKTSAEPNMLCSRHR